MGNIEKCRVCNGLFYPQGLKDGKCVVCIKNYPNANTFEEALSQKGPKKEIIMNLTEDRVKTLIYQILDEAGISQKVCEKCGKKFWSKSPAQKFCRTCQDLGKELKETKSENKS